MRDDIEKRDVTCAAKLFGTGIKRSAKAVRRFNRDERASLVHALMHIEANKISSPSSGEGWYCGNREQFVNRHNKAIALLNALVKK